MLFVAYFVTFAVFSVIFTREVIAPASGASCDKRWRIYAGALNAANLVAVVAAGFLFETWIDGHSLLRLRETVDPLTGSVLTFLAASLVAYWWHRAVHRSDRLWRWVHQLHHSPARIEALTAFYIHPFDALLASLLNAFVAYVVLGVDGVSAALALIYVTLFNLVAHADLRSPWWLGFIVQRPEMHRVHHQRGVHAGNYGLPLWDLVFGTWRNPRVGPAECGFADDKERLIGQMLMLKDVKG
ncbi:sterol desaturase family protein [Caulobacter sp. 17J65-9]|uniref:sterol desaturase family protein n=1 Tax=Caulobacter sp. 17J65-9 TaxID=2709382 RepID=UPI0013CB19CE|nr:sterol desaturase family protein [Caulobacter sp. 17J65-9]NEX92293.1 sterol desaturase family protein [Caulobacter sp. 17J65-9]